MEGLLRVYSTALECSLPVGPAYCGSSSGSADPHIPRPGSLLWNPAFVIFWFLNLLLAPDFPCSAAVPWKLMACISDTSAWTLRLSFISCSNHEQLDFLRLRDLTRLSLSWICFLDALASCTPLLSFLLCPFPNFHQIHGCD